MAGYRDLQVWAKSMDWVEAVYRCAGRWPVDERFGLISQARRAAVSVAANIAEGSGRRTRGEFLQFLGIAKGSLAETETFLMLSARLGYTPRQELAALLSESEQIGRMITALSASLRVPRPKP